MTEAQVEAILIEFLRITRGFGEAIRLISEQKAEIMALQRILEKTGVACAEEIEAAGKEELQRLDSAGRAGAPPGLELMQLDDDGKWKM
jgi:hypothetical protein